MVSFTKELEEFLVSKATDELIRALTAWLHERQTTPRPDLRVLSGVLLRAVEESSHPRADEVRTAIAKIDALPREAPFEPFELFEFSVRVARELGASRVSIEVMLRAIASSPDVQEGAGRAVQEAVAEAGFPGIAMGGLAKATGVAYEGLGYGVDLSRKTQHLDEPPAIGRQKELDQVLTILLAGQNPVLIGEPGVGKTAIVEGLAWMLRRPTGRIPSDFQRMRLVSLQVSEILAGTQHRGELETKVRTFLEHFLQNANAIPFVDEIHSLLCGGQESSAVIVNTLKPEMAREDLRMIGATTQREFDRYFASDKALLNRFRPVRVEEPAEEEAIEILTRRGAGLLPEALRDRGVELGATGIEAAVRMTAEHLPDEQLPRKAIQTIQEAAADKLYASWSQEDAEPPYRVTEDDVAETLANKLSLSKDILLGGHGAALERVASEFDRRIFGQTEATDQLMKGLAYALSGFADADRPLDVVLLYGPPGIGKSACCEVIAETVCGSPQALQVLSMIDYQSTGARSKLMGAAPGYRDAGETWTIFTAVRSRPSSVVVLDRIDSLPGELRPVFSQVLSGRALDGMGEATDFSKCVFVLTAGRRLSEALMTARTGVQRAEALAQALGREVAGLVRNVVRFQPLARESLEPMLQRELRATRDRNRRAAQVIATLEEPSRRKLILDEIGLLGGNGHVLKDVLMRHIGGAAWDRYCVEHGRPGAARREKRA